MQGHCGLPVLGVSGGEGEGGGGPLLERLGSTLLRLPRGLQDQPDTSHRSRLSSLLEIKLAITSQLTGL